MQIESTSLLNMQNTYATKEIAISSQTNQASPESERSSSIPDAGPAAVFEKGGATNGMTETVGISCVAPMGSAGMLYSAGIMSTASNDVDNATESSNGINIDGITTLVNNKPGGSMIGATWSAVIDPANMRDGSVISVNGIKFEFDTDGNTQADADVVKVDINGISDSAVIFQKFVDIVNANVNAKKIAQSIYGAEALPATTNLTGLCSWNNDNCTLQFTQSSSWAREGDTFEVETGKFVNNAFIGSIQPDADATKININNLVDGATMSLTIGAETKTFTVQTATAPPSTEDIISGDTIKFYKPTDISSSTGDLKTSWGTALTAAVNQVAGDDKYATVASIDENGIAEVTITSKDSGVTEQPVLNFTQEGVLQTTNATMEKAQKEAAYLEYEVDINELQAGDYFRFRDMCFIFTDSADQDASNLNIPLGDEVNPVYINISKDDAPTDQDFSDKFKNNFTKQFETYFAPTQSGSSPSRGGSSSSVSSSSYIPSSSRSSIKRYNSDKFNISLNFLSNGKLRIKITATGQKFLEQIALGDKEGWGRSEKNEESGEETVESGEGTESTNPTEGTQGDTSESTASAPDGSTPTNSADPAASSQSETDNASFAESNGANEPNKAEGSEDAATNTPENVGYKTEDAEPTDAETSGTEMSETSESTTTEKTEEKAENSETQETLDSKD